jgi:hypothetical protein
MVNLAQMNSDLEAHGSFSGNLTTEWIWDTDPNEELTPGSLLNRSHLLGMLVCRQRGAQASATPIPKVTETPPPNFKIVQEQPISMNLSQLRDTLDNICVQLSNLDSAAQPQMCKIIQYVDACFVRFGMLLNEGGGPEILNDPLCVESMGADEGALLKINRPCIRRTLNAFLMVFRHLHLAVVATQVPPVPHNCEIHKHHMEASNDEFDLLCMRMSLPVAAVINYKNDFSGFYSHISQVVYFHYPTYIRTQRVPYTDLDKASPQQILPALRLLFPIITIIHEEDKFDITKPLGSWTWIVIPGRIYLAGPKKELYYSKDITALIKLYLSTIA